MCPLGRIEAFDTPRHLLISVVTFPPVSEEPQQAAVRMGTVCQPLRTSKRQYASMKPVMGSSFNTSCVSVFRQQVAKSKISPPNVREGLSSCFPVEQLVWTRTGFQCRLRRVSRRWSWGPPMRHPRSLRAMTGSSSKLWTWHVSSTQPSTALCPLDGIPRALWTQTFARSLPWHVWFAASPSVNKRPRNMMHHTSVHIKTRVLLLVHFDSSTRADS